MDIVIGQDKWINLQDTNNHSKAYMIKGNSAVTLTANSQSIMFGTKNFMLIPQSLTKWKSYTEKTGTYLAVLCRISSLNGSTSTLLYPQPTTNDNKDGKYAFAAVGINTVWEAGKKYTYTLNFCDGPNGGAGFIARIHLSLRMEMTNRLI
ncbi:fimbrillin family protein [Bacteroides helcogenes]|uniref:fimbrillin family protein n=1 Tax=Bacteroides helcogenes TaxID=290053 RepID=UPI000673EDEB|nr:fimbrillin family protein [Bacteroides helcogenes]MDY5237135.1 fimbrillin family protein [Bacteroides helcogenes]